MTMTDKIAVLAVRFEDERDAINTLLESMQMQVIHAHSAQDAIRLIEDHDCDFLISDIQLNDMHALAMLGQLKEVIKLSQLPIVILTDEPAVVPLDNVTPIVRPFAIARLRRVIEGIISGNPDLDFTAS